MSALAGVQRDEPGAVMPDRDWDFVHLELRAKVDPRAGTVEGEAAWDVTPLGVPADLVRMHQAGLAIARVDVDGAPVEGWHTAGEWLEVPVARGVPHRVVVRYTAAPQTGLHFRGGAGAPADELPEVWSQGEGADNRHWFPLWDYPNDRFTVTAAYTVPEGLEALGNGVLVSREAAGGWTTSTFRLDRPIPGYLVALAAGEYTVVEEQGPVPLAYVASRTTSREVIERTLGRTDEMVTYLADLLGEPYPYPAYRQVMVQRYMYGGMENAGLTILNEERRVRDPRSSAQAADSLVAHELAHQWFGDLLTCYGWRELWLNEGFATFYAARWQEQAYGPARMAELVRRWAGESLGDRDAPMAARAYSKVGTRENAAVYVRGASVLHMLRVWLGDEVFDAGIRRYVAEHRDRNVESEDLRRALEDVSGRHLGWVFDQWVTGAGAAKVTSRHRYADGRLEVTIEERPDSPPFVAPVEIEIGTAAGPRIERAELGPGATRVSIPLPERPAYVAVDPRGGVLAEWDRTQTTAEWAAQARDAEAPFARLVAIDALGAGKAEDAAVAALAEIVADPAEPVAVRTAAARALGATRVPRALDVLSDVADDGEVLVRTEALEALGALSLPDGDARALLARVVRDGAELPEVRAAALRALARVHPDGAVDLARSWLGKPDPAELLHPAAADVLGEHGTLSDLRLLARRIDEAETPSRALKAAAAGAAALVKRLEPGDADRALVARRLDALLESPDIRVRQGAIGWLGAAGDERSEQALAAFADRNRVTWGDLSDGALDAARLIRARTSPEEPVPDADVARLEQRLKALEARIDDLESWK